MKRVIFINRWLVINAGVVKSMTIKIHENNKQKKLKTTNQNSHIFKN